MARLHNLVPYIPLHKIAGHLGKMFKTLRSRSFLSIFWQKDALMSQFEGFSKYIHM